MIPELDDLKEKLLKASAGPWRVVGKDKWRLIGFSQVEVSDPEQHYFPVNFENDAEFIVAARNNLPKIFAFIEELLVEREELRGITSGLLDVVNDRTVPLSRVREKMEACFLGRKNGD
jgi:hypothetical protein